MATKIRVIHYLNQFFGGVGGEEAAGHPPQWFDGPKGPGMLVGQLAPDMQVMGTVVAGDNFVAENPVDATAIIVELIEGNISENADIKPDLLMAGPAFNAGRYGIACGAVCQAVAERFSIPVMTAMHPENPALDIYRRHLTAVRTGADVMDMRAAVESMVRVGRKLVAGDDILPAEDGTLPKGLRKNFLANETGARRAINMLLRKLEGLESATEYRMPVFSRVDPAPPVPDMAAATLALVTSGGIVPRGNPDRIESANASRYGEYSLTGLARLSPQSHQTVHGGYDPTFANEDPNRVLPLDVVRQLVSEGRIGRLYETYFATVGNATSVERAESYGREIAGKLVNEGVQAVILTST